MRGSDTGDADGSGDGRGKKAAKRNAVTATQNPGAGSQSKIVLYAIVTLILIVLALISVFSPHPGGGMKSCSSFFFETDRYACVESFAESTLNASACGTLPEMYADQCYGQIAAATNSSAPCFKISNASYSYQCASGIAVATRNLSGCAYVGEPYRSDCLRSIALKTSNLSACAAISIARTRQVCSSLISLDLANRREDPRYCENVTDSIDANLTEYIIVNYTYGAGSGTASQALASLSLLPNVTFTARDFCYTELASGLGSSGICKNVTGSSARAICDSVAAQSSPSAPNSTAASNYTPDYSKLAASCEQTGANYQICIQAGDLARAVATRNATACKGLEAGLDVQCYTAMAETYENSTYCTYITNASEREGCVSGA